MEIRIANKSDYLKLRELWNIVFGDSPDFIDMLYKELDATGYVACEDDTVVSSLTFFEVGEYESRKVKMSYAICTHPNYRGKGYASKLISFVYENEIRDDELSLICPAEKSLIKFYSKTNYQPFFYAKEESLKATEKINISIQSISPKEYIKYRKKFLKDIPHIKLNQNFLEFIEKDSLNSNSLILINGGDAICVIEDIKNDTIIISELLINPILESLSSEINLQIANSIAKHFNTKKYRFRSIARDNNYAQGLINANGKSFENLTSSNDNNFIFPYFGFPID